MRLIKKILNSKLRLSAKKYFPYAFGEIFLIVVGVLIAVSINNYNDRRKKSKEFNSILVNISKDLDSDITKLEEGISEYEELDSIIEDILNEKYSEAYFDSITVTNYMDCVPCFAYNIGFLPFSVKSDGYNQLKSYNSELNRSSENINQEILSFYNSKLEEFKLFEQILSGLTLKNLESFESFDWYVDYISNKYNSESIRYFQNDLSYKNKLATFRLIAIENHLSMLKEYKENAIELSKKIIDKDYD